MNVHVFVATPSTGLCRHRYAMSLAAMVNYFHQVPVNVASSQRLEVHGLEGSVISESREQLTQRFLRSRATHLLFIDEDMGFQPGTLHTLLGRSLPLVACNYRMRVPPAPFVATVNRERLETRADSAGVQEADCTGFGFALIAREVMEATGAPRFAHVYNRDTGHYDTEDVAFFTQAAERGYRLMIDHDASRGVSHIGSLTYRWHDDYSQFDQP